MGFRCPIFGFNFEVSGLFNFGYGYAVEAVLAIFGDMVLAVWF